MRDVLLLLEHLVRNDEVTVKLILDCLYDVGSINLINQKFQNRSLNGVMKFIAKLSKPAFKVIALRWFKRNSPQIITNWLYSKVSFKQVTKKPKPIQTTTTSVAPLSLPSESDRLNQEIHALRSQVRLLRGISIGAIAALSGMIVWLGYSQRLELLQQPVRQLDSESTLTESTDRLDPADPEDPR